MGRNDEGIAELKKAESLDPLSLIISADLADVLCIAHTRPAGTNPAADLDGVANNESWRKKPEGSIALPVRKRRCGDESGVSS